MTRREGRIKPPCTILCLALVLAFAGLSGCGSNPRESKEMALRVNDSEISIQEFNEQIKLKAYSDPEMDISQENREGFADYLIQKELMLQEAVKLKMDQKKSFTRAIEKYWECTLIRILLDAKIENFKKDILVTREEKEAYYVKNKDEFGHPYEEVRERIQGILESKYLEQKIETWTRELRRSADITVNKGFIEGQ